jgi:uncharacterized protein (TIGR03067 family)
MKLRVLGLLVIGLLVGADDAKKDAKKIDGSWTGVSIVRDGNAMPEDEAKNVLVTFKDGKYEVKQGGQMIGKGTIKVDTSKTPYQVEIMVEEGENAGQTELGICEVKDDSMKICFADPGKPRPTEFESKAGSGNHFVTMKRSKS